MTNPAHNKAPDAAVKSLGKRPLLLACLCIFTWIYYGVMALLFILALFYSGWITQTINHYIPDGGWTKGEITLLFLGLFLLYGIAFAGVVFLWNRRPKGYYLFSIPTILIAVLHLFRPEISWLSTAVYAILVILFGLFYREIKLPLEKK